MQTKSLNSRRVSPKPEPKPCMVLNRWGVFGWLMAFVVLSGCMFVIGVIIGRNSVPVFDMDAIDAKMVHLKNSGLEQIEKKIEIAKRQKDHYLEVAKKIDVFEALKEKGEHLFTYKQYVPPVIAPKYNKNDKPVDVSAKADEKMIKEQEMKLAAAQKDEEANGGSNSQVHDQARPETSGGQINTGVSGAVENNQAQPDIQTKKESSQANVKTDEKTEEAIDIQESAKSEIKPAEKITDSARQIKAAVQKIRQQVASTEAAGKNQESKPQASDKQFTIQVAALKELDKAIIVRNKFRQKGYPAYCEDSEVNGVTWHRVRIGPYPDRKIAENDCSRLKEAGFSVLLFVVNGK